MQFFLCLSTHFPTFCQLVQHTTETVVTTSAPLFFSFLQMNHEGKCEFMIIPCPSCKEHIRFNEQERHNERECPERTLNCKYCKEPFHFKNIKVGHDLFRPARMLRGSSGPQRRVAAAPCVTFCFLSGARWDLSQVPDDLWRLRQEENTPRKGESVKSVRTRGSILLQGKKKKKGHAKLLRLSFCLSCLEITDKPQSWACFINQDTYC